MDSLRRVMESAVAGLIVYGAIWALENTDAGEQRLETLVEAVANLGISWIAPLWIASVISLLLGISCFVASKLVPCPVGVGSFDPFELTVILSALSRLFGGAAVTLGVAAGALSLVRDGSVWGIALLAAAALILLRWVFAASGRGDRFLNPGVF